MTRYADKSFSVGGYSPAGRAAFDRIFGKRETPQGGYNRALKATDEFERACQAIDEAHRQAITEWSEVLEALAAPCGACAGTEVVPASGPGTKGQLVMPCPMCQPQEAGPKEGGKPLECISHCGEPASRGSNYCDRCQPRPLRRPKYGMW